ncbi:MAG: type II secretion system F family protein [Chloroflexi bacterium]|nr:type II secretion system F family protein [Chloroflexota bacterium]
MTIVIIGAIVLIVAIILILVGMADREDRVDPLEERLSDYVSRGELITSLEDVELSQPISERIFIPIARKLGEIALRFTPQNALDQTAHKIELAGNPRGMEPTIFWATRFGAAIAVAAFLFFIFSIAAIDWTWGRKFTMIVVFAAIGFYIPELLLTSRINRRQDGVRKAMPDALDLLTICVEAGLSFDMAMAKVAEKWENELAYSFGRALREIQLGKMRREALRTMAERIGIPEMTSFVAAIIQSELLGVSMSKVLRIQSDQMRIRRRQAAEKRAQEAPIKMLFPMALLIFPSIMLILLAPAAIQLMTSALGEMFR